MATDLERDLSDLLEVASFAPPEAFAERALISDGSVHAAAAADPEAWWLEQANELLDWFTPPTQSLDDHNPPFYTWFADGKLNASVNCLDRHVDAGRGDRVALHWHGETRRRNNKISPPKKYQSQKMKPGLIK